ncbi:hypothetical protein DSO57_1013147 [Entomophthora muscae]|uniref:Uncharacterized protein n=1 Tax=Entomophthora muscae TaxID=34485 RepID=A0ACC2TGM7_9FUNG|nr:hypothetical protein DSO57_1013147 [Entomophthora muscae]
MPRLLNSALKFNQSYCNLIRSRFMSSAALNLKTQLFSIDPHNITFDSQEIDDPQIIFKDAIIPEGLKIAAQILKEGKSVVGMPTETVYGLGGNALQAESAQAIFIAKGRPSDNPLIVHVSSLSMLSSLLPTPEALPTVYEDIIRRFWPGPLTILVPKSALIPEVVTGGHDTVAVRFPSHPVARALISLAGVPVAAPSANTSGRPSPTTAQHVFHDLNGKIPCILDSGSCDVGLESTVLDALRSPPVILRPGGVTHEQLMEFFPDIRVYRRSDFTESEAKQLEECPTTPGMKYRHYSPTASVILFDPITASHPKPMELFEAALVKELKSRLLLPELPSRISVMTTMGTLSEASSSRIRSLTKRHSIEVTIECLDAVAHDLFAKLRDLDAPENKVDVAFIQGTSELDLGSAVMNRLRKAATTIIDL